MVDYFSNYWEVKSMEHSSTAAVVINWCREQFGRHGIPDTVMSDNGPQFDCDDFRQFAKKYAFKHVTSSPCYPQSNGQIEKAVDTCKSLMRKAKAHKKDVHLVILDWRNTPTEGLLTSPAQCLMGRRTKTLLPVHPLLLEPTGGTAGTQKALRQAKVKQAKYFNRNAKPLQELKPDDIIRMRRPQESTWSKGKVLRKVGIRSYKVEVNGRVYRRNRRQLRATCEQPDPEPNPYDFQASVPNPESPPRQPVLDPPVQLVEDPPVHVTDDPPASSQSTPLQPVRKSTRNTRLPRKLRHCVVY